MNPFTILSQKDVRLKEQFTNGIHDQAMLAKIIKEFTAIKNTSEVKTEQVLSQTRYTEV